MPAHTAAAGNAPMTAMPMAAAAMGATPVNNPAAPAPSVRTQVYQSTNATAVTHTAR
jgi:hypothetical protein